MKMGVAETIDSHYKPHGNHQGLSVGWLATLFLVYVIAGYKHKAKQIEVANTVK